MKVHIIIISYKRHHLLKRCLLSLKSMAPLTVQAFVLINGEDSESAQVAEQFAVSGLVSMSVFKRPRHSLSEARNFLLSQLPKELSPEDWILFLDDDAYIPGDYGQKLKEEIEKARQLGAEIIGAPNITPPNSSFLEKLSGAWLGSFAATGPMSLRYRKSSEGKQLTNEDSALILCNLLVSASALRKDMFLSEIKGGEENLFFSRFFTSGGKAYLSQDLFVYHHRRTELLSFYQQIYKYGFGRGQVFRFTKRPQFSYFLPLLFFIVCALSFILDLNLFGSSLLISYFACVSFATLRIGWRLKNALALISVVAIPLIHCLYSLGLLMGWADLSLFSKDPSQYKSIS